jgi:hypothetical protein
VRGLSAKRALGTLCVVAVALCAMTSPAQAATDPVTVFVPNPVSEPGPPPSFNFNAPCGLAVDSQGKIYISDYYHHAIDIYSALLGSGYVTQLAGEDTQDGPCGLALDGAAGHLYVNNYHRNVVRFNASAPFGTATAFPLPAEDTPHHLPTGVAVYPASGGNIYVDNRTYISVYDSSGNPVEEGGEPLRIGVGTLGDGYGLAVSSFSATAGRIYVPDAASNTVKIYDLTVSKVTPAAEIKDPFNHPFTSLHDSAIAIDKETGDVYLVDNTQPKLTEKPQATIYIYSSTGVYKGHLKYNIADALQPGLTVDNSNQTTQGRVYVTSGNTIEAGIYAYAPGSGTFGSPLPPTVSLALTADGSGRGSITSSVAKLDCSSSCEEELLTDGEVPLTANPAAGSEFTGWSGACSGSAPTCAVTMDEAASVSAHFAETSPEAGGEGSDDSALAPVSSPASGKASPRHRAHRHHRERHRRHRHRTSRHH